MRQTTGLFVSDAIRATASDGIGVILEGCVSPVYHRRIQHTMKDFNAMNRIASNDNPVALLL